jgi:hypothetical protein
MRSLQKLISGFFRRNDSFKHDTYIKANVSGFFVKCDLVIPILRRSSNNFSLIDLKKNTKHYNRFDCEVKLLKDSSFSKWIDELGIRDWNQICSRNRDGYLCWESGDYLLFFYTDRYSLSIRKKFLIDSEDLDLIKEYYNDDIQEYALLVKQRT